MTETKSSTFARSSLRAYVMIAVLAGIWLYFHWATNSIFLTPRNLSNLATQMSVTGILAVGMLMLIVSGNIDLSVGSVLGFTGGIAAYSLSVLGYGVPAAILFAVAVGIFIGTFQGALTAYLNIPAFIVTLGGLLVWRGAVKWLLGGNTIPISDETFKAIGQKNIPVEVGWIIAILAVVAIIALVIWRRLQTQSFEIQDHPGKWRVSPGIVGLFASVVGMIGFALPWLSVTIGPAELYSINGYNFASGITVGGIPFGGSPIFWLLPISFVVVLISVIASRLEARFVSLPIYVMVGSGTISSLLLTYFLLNEKGYTISYKPGLYIEFIASLITLAIGTYSAISGRYLKTEAISIPSDVIVRLFIPISGILAFMFVMNAYQGVPIPVLIFVSVALVGVFLTTSTVFGRYLYAIGGNPDAARLSGINNKRNILKVYALLGAFTGIAALIFTARVGSAAPDAGSLKELDAIAACVIGGASLMGGRGTVFGACLGALIMASLDNGMSLLNVRDFMQDIIKGSILVAAVGLDMMGRKQS